VGFKIYWKYSW